MDSIQTLTQVLDIVEKRGAEVYKFEPEKGLTPTEVKLENAYKAGYIEALRDMKTVLKSKLNDEKLKHG